jgi:uncharacterized protein (TIGR01777 family)
VNILIAGASGLIGRALKKQAELQGHIVSTLGRSASGHKGSFKWDPDNNFIDKEAFKDVDTIINLSGDNIANGRWTKEKKEKILSSRIKSTSLLVESLKSIEHKVKTLINASAIGYYPSSLETQDEVSQPGTGFIQEVCKAWETEANKAKEIGIRVVTTRIGVVLSKNGGALQKMLLPFKLGLGGPLGNGTQYMSWISLSDVVKSFIFIAENINISGPVNFSSPNPVTNLEYTKTLGKALNRPTIFNAPSFILKIILGEMAESLLLSSARIMPNKLQQAGFIFNNPNLLEYLNTELKS